MSGYIKNVRFAQTMNESRNPQKKVEKSATLNPKSSLVRTASWENGSEDLGTNSDSPHDSLDEQTDEFEPTIRVSDGIKRFQEEIKRREQENKKWRKWKKERSKTRLVRSGSMDSLLEIDHDFARPTLPPRNIHQSQDDLLPPRPQARKPFQKRVSYAQNEVTVLGPTPRGYETRDQEVKHVDYRSQDEAKHVDYRSQEEAKHLEYRSQNVEYKNQKEAKHVEYRGQEAKHVDNRVQEVKHLEYKGLAAKHKDSVFKHVEYRGQEERNLEYRRQEEQHVEYRVQEPKHVEYRNKESKHVEYRGQDAKHMEYRGQGDKYRSQEAKHVDYRGQKARHVEYSGQDYERAREVKSPSPNSKSETRSRQIQASSHLPPAEPPSDHALGHAPLIPAEDYSGDHAEGTGAGEVAPSLPSVRDLKNKFQLQKQIKQQTRRVKVEKVPAMLKVSKPASSTSNTKYNQVHSLTARSVSREFREGLKAGKSKPTDTIVKLPDDRSNNVINNNNTNHANNNIYDGKARNGLMFDTVGQEYNSKYTRSENYLRTMSPEHSGIPARPLVIPPRSEEAGYTSDDSLNYTGPIDHRRSPSRGRRSPNKGKGRHSPSSGRGTSSSRPSGGSGGHGSQGGQGGHSIQTGGHQQKPSRKEWTVWT